MDKLHVNNSPFMFGGNLHYDNFLSSMWYDEFKENASGTSANIMLGSGRNGVDYVVLFDNEAQKDEPYYKKSRLQKMRKDGLIDLWEYHNETCIQYGYNTTYTKAEIIADLMTVTLEQYYRKHYEDVERWYDLETDFVVRGYSQGDAVAVKDLSKSKFWDSEILTNIFYDTPLSGSVCVYDNGEFITDIYLDEFIEDVYGAWQPEHKEALIVSIMKHYGDESYASALEEYLRATLPNDYSEICHVD